MGSAGNVSLGRRMEQETEARTLEPSDEAEKGSSEFTAIMFIERLLWPRP